MFSFLASLFLWQHRTKQVVRFFKIKFIYLFIFSYLASRAEKYAAKVMVSVQSSRRNRAARTWSVNSAPPILSQRHDFDHAIRGQLELVGGTALLARFVRVFRHVRVLRPGRTRQRYPGKHLVFVTNTLAIIYIRSFVMS